MCICKDINEKNPVTSTTENTAGTQERSLLLHNSVTAEKVFVFSVVERRKIFTKQIATDQPASGSYILVASQSWETVYNTTNKKIQSFKALYLKLSVIELLATAIEDN